jgi:homopolymeric O-antigen transport system ATP-binding protein
MSDAVIKVEDLGKRYVLGERELYRNLGETISRAATRPFRRHRSANGRRRRDQVWALKDVSFEVGHGEVIGIIGPNGAGKSTLLKILSRVTRPTTGSARLRGRVASLLEVGTGFHLDLTGRDNVYLNGVVLGMSRREVDRKFDEIVEFAGVERFLDTPVKRYSSGMIVRLGFAVAAHL